MKAMIWIGCLLGASIIVLVARYLGVQLGALPMAILYGGLGALAQLLCKKVDEK